MSETKIHPRVLFLKGPSDDLHVELVGVGDHGEHRIATMGNSSNLFSNLRRNLKAPSAYLLLHPQRKTYPVHGHTQVFFNELADPDNSEKMLKYCHKFLQNLAQKRPISVINPPARVLPLTRDEVHRRLKDLEGVLAPLTIRCSPSSPDELLAIAKESQLDFPFLVRSSGVHGGQDLQKIESSDDQTLLHRYAFDGRSFYLTSFVDFGDKEGRYSKMRIAVVDGVPYIRHFISDHNWCIHSHNRENMSKNTDWIRMEENFLTNFEESFAPLIRDRITAIAQALKLDYFGIDATMLENGSLLIFEANSAMNMLINPAPKPNIFEEPLKKIKKALGEMIRSRLREHPQG